MSYHMGLHYTSANILGPFILQAMVYPYMDSLKIIFWLTNDIKG